MNEAVNQSIKLTLDPSGIPKNSLSALITQLEQVEGLWKRLDAMVGDTNRQLAQTPRKAAEILTQLQKAQAAIVPQSGGGKGFSASAIAKVLGADAAAFESYLARIKKGVAGYHATNQQFRSLRKASEAFEEFESKNYRAAQKRAFNLGSLLKPTVSSVHGTGSIKIDGPIALAIPAAQIQASVVGPIQLAIPGGQITVAGAGAAGGRNELGQFTGGGTTGGKRKKGGTANYLTADELNNLPAGAVVRRRDLASGSESVTVTELRQAGQTLATTFEKIKGSMKATREVLKTPGGLTPLQQFRASRRILTSSFQASVLGLSPSDDGRGLAGIYRKQASQLRSLLTPELEKAIAPEQAAAIKAELEQSALKLESQARAAIPGIQGLREVTDKDIAKVRALGAFSPNGPYVGLREVTGADLAKVQGMGPLGSDEKPSRMQKALEQGFTPSGFATHMVKVAGWAAAVTTLYKSWEMMDYSMHRVLDVGMQMAHLSVIFKQQGGSVKELTDDILSMAAAQGRSTDEAMESATEWARLQLTRQQTNEAVRVSMMAANVAEMGTMETTKQLMSLMHIYHLQVTDLNAELGKLVYTSQHYNVTLEDLFQGLDRAAPQARQMGMSLAELTGIIAGTVGKTGQSGTVVGNTVKYILQEFNRPQIQTMLRGFGIEATTAGGQEKPASEILREVFVRYQSLNPTERQSMTAQLAGRFHGARFVGMMDSYLESQKMAIDSQLNLNAAQTANAAILDTLQNKLEGLRSEWDRFVYSQASRPSAALGGFSPLSLLTGTVGGATTLMQGFDNSGSSVATPLAFAGLSGGRMAARAIAGAMLRKEEAQGAGSSFLLNMGRRFGLGSVGRLLGSRAAGWLGGPIGFLASLVPLAGPIATAAGTSTTALPAGEEWTRVASIIGARGSAASGRANLFQTTLDLLGNKHPDTAAMNNIATAVQLSGTELSSGDSSALQKAFKAGDMATVRSILSRGVESNNAQSITDIQAQAAANQKAILKKQATIDELSKELQGTRGKAAGRGLFGFQNYVGGVAPLSGAAAVAAHLEIENLTGAIKELNDAATQSQGLLEDIEGTPPEELARKQEYISLLKQESELMSAIGTLAEQGNAGTPLDKLNAQIVGAQMQTAVAKSTYDRLQDYINENPEHAIEAAPARDEALQQYQESQAQLDALNSPQRLALAQLEQNREIVFRRANLETTGVGYTEAEKLLNRQKILSDELGGYDKANPDQMSDNDKTRALADAVELEKNRQSIIERTVELRRQEQQILIDSNREFQKAMLFASPGELLQRLYVSQIASQRQPTTGEFMSWSPEMRKMYYDLRGGDAGAKNREEQGLLGKPPSVGDQQKQAGADQAEVNKWRAAVGGDTSAAMKGGATLTLPGEAKVASAQIATLGSTAAATATIFKMLNLALGDFLKNLKPAGTPSANQSSTPSFASGPWLGALGAAH